jgi:hypothetical protein
MMVSEDQLNEYWRAEIAAREQREKMFREIEAAPRCIVLFEGATINARILPDPQPTGIAEGMVCAYALWNDLPEAIRNNPALGDRAAYVMMICPKDDVTVIDDESDKYGPTT